MNCIGRTGRSCWRRSSDIRQSEGWRRWPECSPGERTLPYKRSGRLDAELRHRLLWGRISGIYPKQCTLRRCYPDRAIRFMRHEIPGHLLCIGTGTTDIPV